MRMRHQYFGITRTKIHPPPPPPFAISVERQKQQLTSRFTKIAIGPLTMIYFQMMRQSPQKSNQKNNFPLLRLPLLLPANLVEPRPQPDGRARCLTHTTLPRYFNTKQHRREMMRSNYLMLLVRWCVGW